MKKYNPICPECGNGALQISYLAKALLSAWGELIFSGWSNTKLDINTPTCRTNSPCNWTGTLSEAHIAAMRKEPTLKLIDMSKLPVGTMVRHAATRRDYKIEKVLHDGYYMSSPGENTLYAQPQQLRIAEQKEFTYWPGGERPVPEGVQVEVVIREGVIYSDEKATVLIWEHDKTRNDIIAYRIIGVLSGGTDDPEAAGETA